VLKHPYELVIHVPLLSIFNAVLSVLIIRFTLNKHLVCYLVVCYINYINVNFVAVRFTSTVNFSTEET